MPYSPHILNRSVNYADAAVQTVEQHEAAVQCSVVNLAPSESNSRLCYSKLTGFLRRSLPTCEEALQQNTLADVLHDEFAGLADDTFEHQTSAADKVAECQSISDLVHSRGKALTALQWHPSREGLVAAACSSPLNLSERGKSAAQGDSSTILLWNFRDPVHPEVVLQAPSDVFAFQFHPTQPQYVVAGCLGGQVAMWNLDCMQHLKETTISQPIFTIEPETEDKTDSKIISQTAPHRQSNILAPSHLSLLDTCHQATITDLVWLPGTSATRDGRLVQTSSESDCSLFATVAMDGKLMVWDTRFNTRQRGRPINSDDDILEWRPSLVIPVQNSIGQLFSGTCLIQDPRSSNRFFVGSLAGEISLVDANARQVESSRAHNAVAYAYSNYGRVHSLSYSPVFSDLFLAVSDSGFTVWKDDKGQGFRQHPIFESRFSDTFYTTGHWSLAKPGVLFIGRLDGKLEIWDLLERMNGPVLVASICPSAILAVGVSPSLGAEQSRSSHHHVLAIADAVGVLHIVGIPRTLRRRAHGEVESMAALMDREERRITYVLERQETREKLRKEMEPTRRSSIHVAQGSVVHSSKAPEADNLEPEQREEIAYRKLEADWREKLGLSPMAETNCSDKI